MKVLCGVPKAFCNGGRIGLNHGDCKGHSSHTEAFNCMARYLVQELKFKRIGSREFVSPVNGYVQVLTKKSRYGSALRRGKSGETRGNRYTFKRHVGGAIGDGV